MANATITSSGTWSTVGANPTEIYDGVNNNYVAGELNYKANVLNNIEGTPEIIQFIGLFANGYSIPAGAAMNRILTVLQTMRVQQQPEQTR